MKALLISSLLLAGPSFAAQTGKFIVKAREGVKSLSFGEAKSIKSIQSLNVSFGNYMVLEGDLDSKALESIAAHEDVEYIEKSQTYTYQPVDMEAVSKTAEEIQDTKYSQQWGLKNTGRNSGSLFSPGKKGEDINAEKAWTVARGSKDVLIAVIDTGIDWRHPDLQANLAINEAEKNGEAGVDDDGNGYVDDIYGYDFANKDGDPMDGHGHGTHCAGVIGAVHDRAGIRGVMAQAKIFGVKFLTDRGSGSTEDAILSVDYAIKRGAQVMSNSWGGGGFSQALKDAIQAANDAGIIFVAAAGNSYANNDERDSYPANYEIDNVISVGAMDGAGKKASFSNYGKQKVHVFAPGKDILSTVNNNGYKKMSGTSMACPHVSGVLGLLLAYNPNITPLQARERLEATAVRNGRLDKYTRSGRADAYRLLRNQR